MDALDRPVAEAAHAERAAVAHAAREDPPGVERGVAVVPRRARHLEVVVWLRASDAERREAGPEPRPQKSGSSFGSQQATLRPSCWTATSVDHRVSTS